MELIALKIADGWEVIKNHFYDVDHEVWFGSDGRLKHPFYEDILLLRNPHLRMSIDLGWTPDCDPKGSYKLLLLYWKDVPVFKQTPKQTISKKIENVTLKYQLTFPACENWENPVEQFESRDRFKIRDKINQIIKEKRT